MADKSNVRPLHGVVNALEGTRRDLLVALRDRLWTALNDPRTQPRDLSPLSLRLKELQAEIAQIDDAETWEAPLEDAPFNPDSI